MGHVRLGTLPKTRAWKEVIRLIVDGADAASIADATMRAADKAFEIIQGDKGFSEVVDLLTQLAIAARRDDSTQYLESLGIRLTPQSSLAELGIVLNRVLDRRAAVNGKRSDFGELAQSALVAAVTRHLHNRFGALFSPTSQEIHAALCDLGKKSQFGQLSRTFFSELTYSSMDYFLSKHLGTEIGEDRRFAPTNQIAQFREALRLHCDEAAEIVERYSGDWFSKHFFKDGGEISAKKIDGFGWYGMQKMRDEMKMRANNNGT
jgi:hypothetical protein